MLPGDVSAANTTLAPGISTAQGLFMEMFITAQLVFVVYMLAQEKSRDTFMAPIGIGLALFSAILPGKQPYILNLSLPSYHLDIDYYAGLVTWWCGERDKCEESEATPPSPS
jgi:hypothetical protein